MTQLTSVVSKNTHTKTQVKYLYLLVAKAQAKNEKLIIRAVMASLSLGEATAEAVQRIPDAHCNGEMKAALDVCRQVKEEYADFQNDITIKTLGGFR